MNKSVEKKKKATTSPPEKEKKKKEASLSPPKKKDTKFVDTAHDNVSTKRESRVSRDNISVKRESSPVPVGRETSTPSKRPEPASSSDKEKTAKPTSSSSSTKIPASVIPPSNTPIVHPPVAQQSKTLLTTASYLSIRSTPRTEADLKEKKVALSSTSSSSSSPVLGSSFSAPHLMASSEFAHTQKDLRNISSNISGDVMKEYEQRKLSRMESLKHLYRMGKGPSSSHTIGPRRACRRFLKRCPDVTKAEVTLFDSLALTGKGHLTDAAILEELQPREVTILWEPDKKKKVHNAMEFKALDGKQAGFVYECYSVGGGALLDDSTKEVEKHHVYPYSNFTMIQLWAQETGKQLWQYVEDFEGTEIKVYILKVWEQMKKAIEKGLESSETVLPGVLGTPRRARLMYLKSRRLVESHRKNTLLTSYALAASEENAGGGYVVTAPTCGASGVVPACMYYMYTLEGVKEDDIVRALEVAGVIGNLIKANGSISGAECGCQAEIGSACSMAAGALVYLLGGSVGQIGNAAAMAMEHCLGLTCDPCEGLVQVPCIERNAFYARQAFTSAEIATLEDKPNLISFDEVIFTMFITGKAMRAEYRETSQGGLAHTYKLDEDEDAESAMKKEVRKQVLKRKESDEEKAFRKKKGGPLGELNADITTITEKDDDDDDEDDE